MKKDWLETDFSGELLTLTVDEGVYSATALLRAAYWFTDRAYIFVSRSAEQSFRVHIKAKPPSLEAPGHVSLQDIAGEFGNALLDYHLREIIEDRTGNIRDLLVAKALGEGLRNDPPPGSANDPVADRNGTDLGQTNS
jgi:His-Xaa-Ser system protein HxsD